MERADATWETCDEQQALVALEPDQTDVESALTWAIDAGDAYRALRMSAALFAFWVFTTRLGRSAALLSRVVDLPWESSSTIAVTDRGRALLVAGCDALLADDVDLAARRFGEALTLSEQVADAEVAAGSLRAIASARRSSGDVAAAGQCVERGLAPSRAAGDERGTAWAGYDLGGIAFYRGRVDEALALFEEAVGSFARLGMGFGGYRAQVQLGALRLQLGELALALDCFGRASAIQLGQHFVGQAAGRGRREVAAGRTASSSRPHCSARATPGGRSSGTRTRTQPGPATRSDPSPAGAGSVRRPSTSRSRPAGGSVGTRARLCSSPRSPSSPPRSRPRPRG